ncbi:MAG: hypothetical protein WKI04_06490 [Ferruginibacter sp.]
MGDQVDYLLVTPVFGADNKTFIAYGLSIRAIIAFATSLASTNPLMPSEYCGNSS